MLEYISKAKHIHSSCIPSMFLNEQHNSIINSNTGCLKAHGPMHTATLTRHRKS